MTTARMPGRVRPSWCPHCRTTPGPDCPDTGRTPKQVRRAEQRQVEAEIAEALEGDRPRGDLMDELVAWFRQQLDEDEEAARDVHPGPWRAQPPSDKSCWDGGWEVVSDAYQTDQLGHPVVNVGDPTELNYRRGGTVDEEHARYIAWHDPAAVLADVAAKRAILDSTVGEIERYGNMPPEAHIMADEVVKALARAYRHRPGWKTEWEE